jgi:hypothetical protein
MNYFVQYLAQATRVRPIESPIRVLGIDLGTTNCTAAGLSHQAEPLGFVFLLE